MARPTELVLIDTLAMLEELAYQLYLITPRVRTTNSTRCPGASRLFGEN